MNKLLSPSLLAADFMSLRQDIEMINRSEADWLHLDIMDGVFVPNLSFGFSILDQIGAVASKPLDVHLMIVDPDKVIDPLRRCGASIVTVHYEASPHLHRTVSMIKQAGMKAGVALNPHTPVELLRDILGEIDMVLLMSVDPGYGGQSFIAHSIEKVKRLRRLMNECEASPLVQMDGGIGPANAQTLYEAGVDVLVVGSAIFSSPDPLATIASLKR